MTRSRGELLHVKDLMDFFNYNGKHWHESGRQKRWESYDKINSLMKYFRHETRKS